MTKLSPAVSAVLLSLCACSCTSKQVQQAKAITDVAGNVCEVVFQYTDPAVAPLCTTVADLIVAVETVIPTTDAGTSGVRVGASGQLSRPLTADERAKVYVYLSTLQTQRAIKAAK